MPNVFKHTQDPKRNEESLKVVSVRILCVAQPICVDYLTLAIMTIKVKFIIMNCLPPPPIHNPFFLVRVLKEILHMFQNIRHGRTRSSVGS